SREIGAAMLYPLAIRGSFPGPSIGAPAPGNPFPAKPQGLSWRVALLPYLGEEKLYAQFRLDEPWDSPNNLPLLKRMPKVYELPGGPSDVPAGYTFYQVVVGPGAIFDPQH